MATMMDMPIPHLKFDEIDLQERIGKGTVSVYRATWSGEEIAVKKMDCDKNQILREVEVHNSLPLHPNVLPLIGVAHSKDGFTIYVCMELADTSLHHYLHTAKNKPSLQQSTKWAMQIAKGMHHLHQHGLAHRDLKSANVLLFKKEDAMKVCDFGSARHLEGTATMTAMTGTLRWMAPEFNNTTNTKVNQRCDVFSYGMVLYEIFAHEIPFPDIKEAIDVVFSIRSKQRPSLPQEIPQYLKNLMQSCWEHDPHDRPTFEVILQVLATPPLSHDQLRDTSLVGLPPLHKAAESGDADTVERMITTHVNVNSQTVEDGKTALHFAAGHGHIVIVQMLLKANADLHMQDKGGLTALYYASIGGYLEIVELLLQGDSDTNICNTSGFSALHWACMRGHNDVVDKLLKNGANPNLATPDGLSPLYCACSKGHTEVVRTLLKGKADPNLAMKNGLSPLYVASENGYNEVVDTLLKGGADPNLATKTGFTPYYAASKMGHTKVVETLLNGGADPNKKSDSEEEDKLMKPSWVQYFCLPKADVELEEPFLPEDEFLPSRESRMDADKMYSGWWTRREITGEVMDKMKVLIKPVHLLNGLECRVLSILGKRLNLAKFCGALLHPPTTGYHVVLENCDVGYLRDYVLNTRNHFDPTDFARQIANGMCYLHHDAPHHPIVHRNLNPLSVLLRWVGDRIVLELHGFQHARIMGELGDEVVPPTSETSAPVSHSMWLAPELSLDPSSTDLSSDVYSFGMVVWHLFSRKLPFEGKKMSKSEIMTLTGTNKERPTMPPYEGCPKFWLTLIDKCWQHHKMDRPDFRSIMNAMARRDESLLEPPHPLVPELPNTEQAERASWELDPDVQPTEGEQILSSNKRTSTVVVARYEESVEGKVKRVLREVALKRPVKLTTDIPTKAEFQAFMETAQKISHPHILSYEGVLLLESIQMPLMEVSVRQYLWGKRIKDSNNRRKAVLRGFGSMLDTQVTHVMKCVLEGLHYLHTVIGIAHGGLSTSNVLINKKSPWEVKLIDYNMSALGIESHSHAARYLAPPSVEGTPRGDLYSCGIMFVEMLTGKDRILTDKKKTRDWEHAKIEVERIYPKIWKAVTSCEDYVQLEELTAQDVLNLL